MTRVGKRKTDVILVGKIEAKKSLGNPLPRWEGNVKKTHGRE